MAAKVNRSDFSINTIIGPGTNVWGDVEAAGFTRIDGALHGDLAVQGRIVIGEKACLKSSVSGTSVTIGGIVYGNVIATDRLVLLSTGLVVGDVITRRIQIDDGCLVHGKIVVCKDEEKMKAALAEHHDAEGVRQALKKRISAGNDDAPPASITTASPPPVKKQADIPAIKKNPQTLLA
ncbi:MAG: polymer-forming cytoskeletal protein [Spirochaetaceae bacterium]|nr:polymer-forming cytoskeletal protein [Spirochaetaceae bacterium]